MRNFIVERPRRLTFKEFVLEALFQQTALRGYEANWSARRLRPARHFHASRIRSRGPHSPISRQPRSLHRSLSLRRSQTMRQWDTSQSGSFICLKESLTDAGTCRRFRCRQARHHDGEFTHGSKQRKHSTFTNSESWPSRPRLAFGRQSSRRTGRASTTFSQRPEPSGRRLDRSFGL